MPVIMKAAPDVTPYFFDREALLEIALDALRRAAFRRARESRKNATDPGISPRVRP